MMERILVVDDERAMRLGVTEVLERHGFAVTAVDSGAAALAALGDGAFGLVVSDMRMPIMTGAELLAAVQERHPGVPVVMMTAYGTVEDAVAAMKAGARDFLTKPFAPGDLVHLVRNVLRDPAAARGAGGSGSRGPGERRIVTRAPVLQRVLAVAAGVAGSRAPILLEGESGTGKELVARYVHQAGPRRDQPFVAVNCAALPRELLESELFGHERGAFTGATARKLGKFELAHGGTLLLDEVSEMEPLLQAKLLRVLQEHEVDRVGGARPIAIDTRVIATTNRPLRALVASGAFRRDLYYRLNVLPLTLPPLRSRREDIDDLIDHFCRRFATDTRLTVDAAARAYLKRQPFPGNVRELEHVIERAALLAAGGVITAADVQIDEEPIAEPSAAGSLAGLTVHEVERRLIMETLKRTNNNRSRAAEMLGISVRTLRNKLAEYRMGGSEAVGAA
ncbi:MAG: sigma-54-dependent Fis family transcriptional regulator [Deltaproteobacteria bacterium]|nr:sigma-54-dependent Fis family transcriptional regulator [Deltaproteobacteria bacterium]